VHEITKNKNAEVKSWQHYRALLATFKPCLHLMRHVFVLLLCDNSSDQGCRDAHKPLTTQQMVLKHQTSDKKPNEGRVFFLYSY